MKEELKEDINAALQAIADGYYWKIDDLANDMVFVEVENPKFQPDDGSDPYLGFFILDEM
jgi:hypothetical protein